MQDEQVLPRYEELLEGSKVAFVRDKVTNIVILLQSQLQPLPKRIIPLLG